MTGSMKNPFLIYGYEDPAHFCDREEETADIISALRNGRNISLIAPRRMGKTGLIHNVFHRIRQTDPSAACFYVDIFATKTLDDFKGSGDMSLSLLTDEHKGFSHRSHRLTQMIHVLSHGTDARSKSRDKARFGYALQEGGRPKVKTMDVTDEHTVCADGNGNLMFFGDCLSKYC